MADLTALLDRKERSYMDTECNSATDCLEELIRVTERSMSVEPPPSYTPAAPNIVQMDPAIIAKIDDNFIIPLTIKGCHNDSVAYATDGTPGPRPREDLPTVRDMVRISRTLYPSFFHLTSAVLSKIHGRYGYLRGAPMSDCQLVLSLHYRLEARGEPCRQRSFVLSSECWDDALALIASSQVREAGLSAMWWWTDRAWNRS